MLIENAVKSGKKFKIDGEEKWLYVHKNGTICIENTILPAQFTKEMILSNKWIVKEEWYEGNFKEKYPNGVFCLASVDDKDWFKDTIEEYIQDIPYPFIGTNEDWMFVKPIPKDEIPYIFTKEED